MTAHTPNPAPETDEARRPYREPTLRVYGQISTLTEGMFAYQAGEGGYMTQDMS